MFEHWTQYATEYAPHIGLTPQQALNAHALVLSVMGSEWIDAQEEGIGLPSRTMADTHPLFFALRSRTEFSIVDVCQLAGYLLAFRDDPGLNDVIVALRDANKYEAAVQELAFAWKFRGAGAAVELGPKTATGVADFAASLTSRKHIVEVSGFPGDPFKSDLMAFTGATQSALKSALKRSPAAAPVALEVVVNDGRRADLRKLRGPMHAAVVDVMKDAVANGLSAARTFEFGKVRVRRAQPGEVPDTAQWSIAGCLLLVPRSELNLLGTADYRVGKETQWVYVRIPDDTRDPYEKIRSKLKIESRQLRRCEDGVIILVVNGLHAGTFDDGDEQLRALIEDFARQHKSTTGIAIVTMPRKQDGTSGVAGPYYELSPTAMPASFWEKVKAVDRERSVLWELDGLA